VFYHFIAVFFSFIFRFGNFYSGHGHFKTQKFIWTIHNTSYPDKHYQVDTFCNCESQGDISPYTHAHGDKVQLIYNTYNLNFTSTCNCSSSINIFVCLHVHFVFTNIFFIIYITDESFPLISGFPLF